MFFFIEFIRFLSTLKMVEVAKTSVDDEAYAKVMKLITEKSALDSFEFKACTGPSHVMQTLILQDIMPEEKQVTSSRHISRQIFMKLNIMLCPLSKTSSF